jgi:hypothetical protein
MENVRGYVVGVDETPTAEKEEFQADIIQLGGTVHGSKGRGYLYYLTLGGGTPGQAYNLARVQERAGVRVWIGWFKSEPVIMRLDKSRMEPNGYRGYRSPLFAQHAPDHGWAGGDPDYVDTRRLKDLMVRPAGEFKVHINPGRYGTPTGRHYFPGYQNYDLAAHQPAVAGTKRRVGLYLDAANTLQEVAGGLFAVTAVLPELAWPTGAFPLISFILFGNKDFVDFEYVKQEKVLWTLPADGKVLVSATDTTPGYLEDKILPLTHFEFGIAFEGGNEQFFIYLDQTTIDHSQLDNLEVGNAHPQYLAIAQNTSGATAAAGDVGYIDGAGEYKTTTTTGALVSWCVVVTGGVNSQYISVARAGKRTVNYTGSDPAQGDYLTTSTVAGSALAQAFVSPAIFAVCQEAGSGGTVEALLLTGRATIPRTDSHYFYGVDSASDSNFVSTIATLPGGAALTYGAVSAGAANTIVPWAALDAAFNGKVVLHNTTRGTSALISAVVTGTSTITLTANVPAGWTVGDTITAKSQTNTSNWTGGAFYFDLDFSGMTTKPTLAVATVFHLGISDSGAAGAIAAFHPFETNSPSKSFQQWGQATNQRNLTTLTIPVNQSKICIGWDATGSGTCRVFLQHVGWIEATP